MASVSNGTTPPSSTRSAGLQVVCDLLGEERDEGTAWFPLAPPRYSSAQAGGCGQVSLHWKCYSAATYVRERVSKQKLAVYSAVRVWLLSTRGLAKLGGDGEGPQRLRCTVELEFGQGQARMAAVDSTADSTSMEV